MRTWSAPRLAPGSPNDFGDPFFIDLDEEAQGFPVYYAPHGAGRWDAERVASSLRHFAEILAALRDIGADETAAQNRANVKSHLLEFLTERALRLDCAQRLI
ncbi:MULTISPECIES: hypothetical protein [unclassified Pseudomonas]|uniref:hypothetical protein n=1 Tax=unclassified Pseudomonas TaxID=196821 RepID=UPI00244AF323|nr:MULTISPECIES: hypothetical protein [unclassified Pseudomonas]MDG9927312.1 hypothetical protein [Pseudomonas sp. GD04042]MDH0482381.1 hypothetical protein [Pseudomonas sp. GD04015]MDH0602733.1 hypothetical protein [Pseudomonas sp. GD03869]